MDYGFDPEGSKQIHMWQSTFLKFNHIHICCHLSKYGFLVNIIDYIVKLQFCNSSNEIGTILRGLIYNRLIIKFHTCCFFKFRPFRIASHSYKEIWGSKAMNKKPRRLHNVQQSKGINLTSDDGSITFPPMNAFSFEARSLRSRVTPIQFSAIIVFQLNLIQSIR